MLLDHNILGLDVPVYDVLTLQVVYSLQQLLHHIADRHVAVNQQIRLNTFVQLSTVVELTHNVECLRVLVQFVNSHYVWVVQLLQDYYFQELHVVILGKLC
jgi:hypothetical protein